MNRRVICLSLLLAGAAQAHVSLDLPQALAGTAYRAVFRVGHGCEGEASTRITVRLPAGLRATKPMPKAGWLLDLTRSPSGELTAVSWTARTPADALQDEWVDEFVLRTLLPASPGPLGFAVRQDCGAHFVDWSGPAGSPTPAPLLRLIPSPNQELP
jgi:periplasmic copper chaperone A